MTDQPISAVAIVILSAEFIAVATILGNPIRRFLLRAEALGFDIPFELKWIFSVATGVAFLALLLLWIGLVPGMMEYSTAVILMVVAIGANLFIYRTQIRRLPLLSRQHRDLVRFKGRWFIAVFLVILVVQMSPLVSLWVTPGDDAKLYSLIALRILQSQGLPKDWGIFAYPNWYVEHVHLLIPGFSAEIAFINLLTGGSIPASVSILASLFRGLAPASVYALALVLTRRRLPSIVAMAVYGLLIVEPTFGWFTWGGMAELSAITILPVACAGTYLLAKGERFSWKIVLWSAILVAGMSMLHPFAFFYYLAFLLAMSGLLFARKRFSRGIWVWFPGLLGLLAAAGPLWNAFLPELSISQSYSTGNPSWTPTFSLSQTIPQAIGSAEGRLFAVYGLAATLLLLIGLAASKGMLRSQKPTLALLGLWYLALFLLHENNPNGLFVIPFPLWYRIDANRTFGMTSLTVALVIGLIAQYWTRRTLHTWTPLREVVTSSKKLIRQHWKLTTIAVCLLLLVSVQEISNANILFNARTNSPVTAQDIAAFNWIQSQTPANATFFTNTADAGTWIPIYADRRVVMPFGVVTNNTLLADYETAVAIFSLNPSNSTGIQFMNMTGATYVYSGPSRIYGRQGFDPAKIMATQIFVEVYHQQNVWIFRLK